MTSIELGASLYVPATRPDLVRLANGQCRTRLRSVIFCTEDAIRKDELTQALSNLATALPQFRPGAIFRFVRVRSPEVLHDLLRMKGVEAINGIVIPKATCRVMPAYFELLADRPWLRIMPTLESSEVFDSAQMCELRSLLTDPSVMPRVLSLRIGGSDLLNLLGVKRSPRQTIHETVVGPFIAQLSGLFRPWGFNLTGPVFDGLAHPDVLKAEVEQDLAHALFGKSAVHPDQVPIIEAGYAVSTADVRLAERLLDPESPAVFRADDRMCEPSTQATWARTILARSQVYGERG